MSDFKVEKNNEMTVLFVNSEVHPHREIPLNHYRVDNIGGEERFSRLYQVEYLQEEQIIHRVLQWKTITIKEHHKPAMRALISMNNSAHEYVR